MKIFRIIALGCLIWTVDMSMGLSRANAADAIHWNEYMQSASVAAAIASAISVVDHCSRKPLSMEEIATSDDRRTLVFTCDGEENEEGSAMLHLMRYGDGPWIPVGFDYAG